MTDEELENGALCASTLAQTDTDEHLNACFVDMLAEMGWFMLRSVGVGSTPDDMLTWINRGFRTMRELSSEKDTVLGSLRGCSHSYCRIHRRGLS
jgi:hypothetical protein